MTTDSIPLPESGVEQSADTWVADSTPYPWPYDGQIEAASLALVIVLPGVPVTGITPAVGEAAMSNIAVLAEAVASFGGEILNVTTTGPHARAVVEGGGLWSPPSMLVDVPNVIDASGLDGFFGSHLETRLRRSGRTHLLLVGAPLETAVHSTMRTANDEGYECLLVEDACAALHPELKPNTLSMIEMSGGIFGAIGTTANVLAALRS